MTSPDSLYSSLREKTVEHLFLGQVLRELWNTERYTTEVSRAESDSFGYDVVIETRKVIRHIQLKSRRQRKPRRISISTSLADKPSGCVIVIMLSETLEIESFLWFGNGPKRRLDPLDQLPHSKRLRRDGARVNHVDVPLSKFVRVDNVPDLVLRLFGKDA